MRPYYDEALQTAMKWYMQGAPEKRKQRPEYKFAFDFENLVSRLTTDEAKTLYDLIGTKFRFVASVQTAADSAPQVMAPSAPVVPTRV